MTYTFPEALHVDGKDYRLYSYPLESYVATRPSWPRFLWPRRLQDGNGGTGQPE